MRLSGGGCYEIAGAQVRRVADGPAEAVGLARWQERQADLWAESATIAHEYHSLSAEENALWNAMWKELEAIKAVIALLEGGSAVPTAP
jgi:hypothetical protein